MSIICHLQIKNKTFNNINIIYLWSSLTKDKNFHSIKDECISQFDTLFTMYIHLLSIVFILLQSTDLSRSADAHWDYRSMGPDVWRDSFPACAGNSQSPINILSACTIYQQFEPFHFSEAYDITQDFILTNNGHTIVGQQVNKSAYPLTLTGGGLTEPFTFVNFHLHWGENYASGSEHQM